MRTTLNIDDDVMFAARELARIEGKTAGQIVSELARRALQAKSANEAFEDGGEFYGFRPLPKRDVLVSNEIIDSLRHDEGI